MLSELFDEILDSEKSFKVKVDRLRTLAENIEKCQKELDVANGELETLQGEVLVKSQRLSVLTVDVCSHNVLVGALREQKGTLQVEKEELERQLAAVSEEADREREAFLVRATSFGNKYGLGSDTKRVTEECLAQEAASLQEEITLLQAELGESERQREEVSRLSEALERARAELVEEEKEVEEATNQARVSKEELQAAEREYEHLLQWGTADPEFARLQAELEHHRQGGAEELCRQLRRELEAVQEQYYAQRWRTTKGGGAPCHWNRHSDPSQQHKVEPREQGMLSRNYFDDSPSSSPVDDRADLVGGGATGTQGGPASINDEGGTLHTPPEILVGVWPSGRPLSPRQQTIRPHKLSHSTRGSKTVPLAFEGWKRPTSAVLQKEFTSASGHTLAPPAAGVKKVRFQY